MSSTEITLPVEVTVVPDKFLSAPVRNWLYEIVLTVIPLLIVWGKLTHDTAQYIINVVAAVLGFGAVGLSKLNKPQRVSISTEHPGETGHIDPVEKGGDKNGK